MLSNSGTTSKRIFKTAMAILLAIAVFVVSTPELNSRADNTKIAELEAKIKEAKAQKDATQSKINESKKELETLNTTTTTLKGTLNGLNAELSQVCDNLSNIESRIETKNAEIDEMSLELAEAIDIQEEQYKAMKLRIKYMYEKQDYALFESVMGSRSFSDFLNKNDYFEALTAYDRRMLDEYKETCRVIGEAKDLLEEQRKELDGLHEEALNEQNRVSELVSRTANTISDYRDEIEETEQEMAAHEEVLATQKANLSALQAELAEERRLSELANKSAWRDISQVSFAEGDRYLLANLIYCEAGNQPFEGQVAVGAVVMNRVMSSVFPNTVVEVIYQRRQFSPAGSGRLALALARDDATASCYSAADAAMAGQTTVSNCLFFRTPIDGIDYKYKIAGHIFY